MAWYVVPVAALGALPVGLPRVHPVAGSVHAVFVGHVVKDVELELWPPAALVGDVGLLQMSLGAEGDVTWIVGKDGLGVRLQRGADKAECGRVPEGIHCAGGEIRH
jgi:hypothetical protein